MKPRVSSNRNNKNCVNNMAAVLLVISHGAKKPWIMIHSFMAKVATDRLIDEEASHVAHTKEGLTSSSS
jgi:hypothetical protein